MALVRDFPFTMNALQDTILVTCSAIMSTAGSTSPKGMLSVESTAGAAVSAGSETTAFGRIIDRTRFPIGARYQFAVVGSWLHSTRGSTEADRNLSIGVKIQHGDSSGGGDMADLSTGAQPATREYFSTARSTDHASWDATESTGEIYAASNPGVYDLRPAKRYIRVAVPVAKNRVTTESSGDEQARLGATITFLEGDVLPQIADVTGPYSSSTTT
jgi:hypothetical protein